MDSRDMQFAVSGIERRLQEIAHVAGVELDFSGVVDSLDSLRDALESQAMISSGHLESIAKSLATLAGCVSNIGTDKAPALVFDGRHVTVSG